jgi:hypothetical protein
MARIEMATFARPALRSRSVVACEITPALRGDGPHDYACGGCGVVLANGFYRGQLQRLGFRCGACGVYSEPPGETASTTAGGLLFPVGIYRTSATIAVPGRLVLRGERSQ